MYLCCQIPSELTPHSSLQLTQLQVGNQSKRSNRPELPSIMSRIIAVHGATGMQGGSVVKSLLKSDWKVRAITRNASGAAAKSLSEAGIQVVTADFDDEASLIKAYEVRS